MPKSAHYFKPANGYQTRHHLLPWTVVLDNNLLPTDTNCNYNPANLKN